MVESSVTVLCSATQNMRYDISMKIHFVSSHFLVVSSIEKKATKWRIGGSLEAMNRAFKVSLPAAKFDPVNDKQRSMV